ncbi:hypothetical protein OG458_04025 [Streptomyces sp. NBC_01281]|uniref:hypothetical protein n=1 Tax=unclassified Streptomyces TaxID=2593676 RepID=UPI0009BD409D|nr:MULTISPECIES: hypothetical protein [unclassified Streptomyces]MCX5281079.1 hypothetical protein [Streptomyces sp. NBC_00198]OQQ19953.1 hypothetical protein B0675_25005 [Streptomyces sp. M41(2017)]WSK59137.1 hypothetical protein OG458_04025 [Streptomyces sp. NBC_01281]
MAGSARARIIALAGRRSWIVVEGRLPRSAAPYLSAVLRERCGQQAVVFLDLRQAQLSGAQEPRGAFLPDGPRVFHVMAEEPWRSLLARDRRVRWHGCAEEAWQAWCSGP